MRVREHIEQAEFALGMVTEALECAKDHLRQATVELTEYDEDEDEEDDEDGCFTDGTRVHVARTAFGDDDGPAGFID
jgi:hypothetical protein